MTAAAVLSVILLDWKAVPGTAEQGLGRIFSQGFVVEGEEERCDGARSLQLVRSAVATWHRIPHVFSQEPPLGPPGRIQRSISGIWATEFSLRAGCCRGLHSRSGGATSCFLHPGIPKLLEEASRKCTADGCSSRGCRHWLRVSRHFLMTRYQEEREPAPSPFSSVQQLHNFKQHSVETKPSIPNQAQRGLTPFLRRAECRKRGRALSAPLPPASSKPSAARPVATSPTASPPRPPPGRNLPRVINSSRQPWAGERERVVVDPEELALHAKPWNSYHPIVNLPQAVVFPQCIRRAPPMAPLVSGDTVQF